MAKVVRKHLHIKSVMQGLVIGASILPSLKAQYKTEAIILSGVLGRKAHFTVTLPTHLLSFKSKVQCTIYLYNTFNNVSIYWAYGASTSHIFIDNWQSVGDVVALKLAAFTFPEPFSWYQFLAGLTWEARSTLIIFLNPTLL